MHNHSLADSKNLRSLFLRRTMICRYDIHLLIFICINYLQFVVSRESSLGPRVRHFYNCILFTRTCCIMPEVTVNIVCCVKFLRLFSGKYTLCCCFRGFILVQPYTHRNLVVRHVVQITITLMEMPANANRHDLIYFIACLRLCLLCFWNYTFRSFTGLKHFSFC